MKLAWGRAATFALVLFAAIVSSAADARPPARRSEIRFEPTSRETTVPEPFRLNAHAFPVEERPLSEVSDSLAISLITFPSPVVTPHPRNNTVHCEYFRPARDGKVAGVIVLHILGGDFELARLFCNALAHHGVAALFLKMPYYGPRRDPKVSRRMISDDPRETVAGMTQAILDVRRATAWLAARPEIDADQLGIFGISLGGITAGLAATAEPRLRNICLMLAGGDIARIAWESPELDKVRRSWVQHGGTREEYLELMQTVDPVRYGANVRGRRILMLNARHDEVIPQICTESLWKAFGEPEIVWYSGGHYSSAWHIFSALARVTRFFGSE